MLERDSTSTIFLIHGTYVNSETTAGPSWWRPSSDFSRRLEERLSGHAHCQTEDELIRWSGLNGKLGPNSERARRAAATALLSSFERLKTPFHVIAHSHGGNILWTALTEASRRGLNLPNLITFATVGTPFLHFRLRWANLWMGIPMIASAVALVFAARWSGLYFGALGDLAAERQFGATILIPLLHLFLFASTLYGGYRFAVGVVTAFQHRREERARKRAWHEFGPRWLGLWSRSDEAINGLKSTLGLGGRLVPGISLWSMSRYTRWYWWVILLPLLVLFLPFVVAFFVFRIVYNRIIAPYLLDDFVWDTVARKSQGSDHPGLHLASVSEGPISGTPGFPPLPGNIDRKLIEEADSHAARTLPKLRQGLGIVALEGAETVALVEWFGGQVSGRELVHTSYFAVREVEELLCHHIQHPPIPGADLRNRFEEMCARVTPADAVASAEEIVAPQVDGHRATPPSARRRGRLALSCVVFLTFLGLIALANWTEERLFHGIVVEYTDEYNIEKLLKDAPVAEAASDHSSHNFGAVILWSNALIRIGRRQEALDAFATVRRLDSDLRRTDALLKTAKSLLQTGWKDEAIETLERARLISDDIVQAKYGNVDQLLRLSELLSKVGKTGDANAALVKALAALTKYEQKGEKPLPSVYIDLSRALASAGRLVEADETLDKAFLAAKNESPFWRRIYIKDVAVGWVERNELNRALTVAQAVEGHADEIVAEVIRSLLQADKLDDALAITSQLHPGTDRCHTLVKLASELYRKSRAKEASSQLDQALSDAGGIEGHGEKVYALYDIAETMTRLGRSAEAQTLFDQALAAVAQIDTRDVSKDVPVELIRSGTYLAVADSLIRSGLLDRANVATDLALAAADRVTEHDYITEKYIDAAGVLNQLGRRAEADQVVGKALSISQLILNEDQKSKSLAKVAKVLALLRHYRAARLACDRCQPVHRLKAYAYIVNQYVKTTRGVALTGEEERLED